MPFGGFLKFRKIVFLCVFCWSFFVMCCCSLLVVVFFCYLLLSVYVFFVICCICHVVSSIFGFRKRTNNGSGNGTKHGPGKRNKNGLGLASVEPDPVWRPEARKGARTEICVSRQSGNSILVWIPVWYQD